MARTRVPAVVALLVALTASGAACRGRDARGDRRAAGSGIDDATGLPDVTGPDGEDLTAPGGEVLPTDVPTATTEPGPYADDERYAALADGFEDRVRAAADRLDLVTGLSFRDRAAPRVVLRPLRAETPPFTVEREVAAGRRRSLIEVNLRPLVSGREDADRLLVRALAEAALVPASGSPPPPRWFAAFAGHFAAGDTADGVERLARAHARGGARVRVDPDDPAHAEETALAVALLLAERSTPADVRRLLTLAADGDDPVRLVRKALGDPTAPFSGDGREILEDAMARVDLEGDRLVGRLRDVLERLGPAGLEATLEDEAGRVTPTDRVRAEVEALRLEGALRTGDVEAGHAVLGRAPCASRYLALLDDPAAYVMAAARLELLDGGDPVRAYELLVCYDRDYPTNPGRAEAFEELERLLARLPPDLEAEGLERVLAERGPAGLATATIVRRVDRLLADARPGAARRFLASLGARADDEALADVRARVDLAEADPTPEDRDRNRARVAAWVDAPTPATEADVVDGGAVAADALVDRLPPAAGDERAKAVRLLLRAAGTARAVALLASEWSGAVERFPTDLEVLASACGYADLRRTVEALFPAARTDARAAAEWERVCLGIDPVRLASDDELLMRLYAPEFSVRRAAFEEVTSGSAPVRTPLLLRHFARDPAVLLRRLAVRVAAKEGLGMIAQEALADPSGIVRQAACAGIVEAGWYDAAPDIARLLRRPDPDERVQDAAAVALVRIAAERPGWVRPVVSVVRVADVRLADGVAALLPDLPKTQVAAALAAELRTETLGPDARFDRATVFRLFTAYRRASGREPGYDPSLTAEEVRALVLSLPENGGAPAGR